MAIFQPSLREFELNTLKLQDKHLAPQVFMYKLFP